MAKKSSRELNTKGVAAGGGIGTVLVVIAKQLPPGNEPLAAFLVYIAPGVSVAATAAWVIAAAWLKHTRSRYVADRALKRARTMRDEVCGSASASDGHKAQLCEKVEHFERLTMALIQAEFDSVEAVIKP